jgi:signal transduction histidine kinase
VILWDLDMVVFSMKPTLSSSFSLTDQGTFRLQHESHRTLRVMTSIVVLFTVMLFILTLFFDALIIRSLSLLVLVLTTSNFWLLKRRYFISAAWLMSLTIVFSAFTAAYLGSGIYDVAILLLPVGVIFSGMVLPLRQIWMFVMLTSIFAVVLSTVQWNGWLPNLASLEMMTVDYIVFPLFVLGTQVLMMYTTQRMRVTLFRTQREKARWQTIFQFSRDGMLILNKDGQILDANPMMQDWLVSYLRIEDKGWLLDLPLTFWNVRHQEGARWDWEIPSQDDNSVRVCEIVMQGMMFQDEDVWVCTARDVTEDRALKAQILQEDAIKIMGKLSTTVAHDLNNHLASIMALSDLLQMSELNVEGRQLASEIGETALRAGKRTSEILSSVRNNPKALKLVRPGRLMDDLRKALSVRLHSGIQLEYQLTSVYQPILLDRSRLFDALFNIGLNAIDAVATVPNPKIQFGCDLVEGGVHFWVSDNGVGMTPSELQKVRNAFFTTKEKGSGLGLFSVEMCVAAHGGQLNIQSEPNKGSLFQLFIPSKQTSLSIEKTQPIDLSKINHNMSLIQVLLIEDNEHLGAMLKKELESVDMLVTWVQSGEDARLEVGRNPLFDIFILDYRLPDCSGLELLEDIAHPHIPIVAISGDVSAWDASSKRFPIVTRIAKPFRIKNVVEAIQKNLGMG